MKTNNFSIVVGTAACNASCPFCISKITGQAGKAENLNGSRLHTACQLAKQASDGVTEVIITGKGEPMLYPDQISCVLAHLDDFGFPLVTLQTNGSLVGLQMENMKMWRDMGLNRVCISITHWDSEKSSELMGLDFDFWGAVELLHGLGISVRLNCTLTKAGIYKTDDVLELLKGCKDFKVEQLTVRDVAGGSKWVVENNMLVAGDLQAFFNCNGTKLLDLPHGGAVYDYDGQNVCVTNCLTGDAEPSNTRQIIYFPDGRIMYDWRYPGARIL